MKKYQIDFDDFSKLWGGLLGLKQISSGCISDNSADLQSAVESISSMMLDIMSKVNEENSQ